MVHKSRQTWNAILKPTWFTTLTAPAHHHLCTVWYLGFKILSAFFFRVGSLEVCLNIPMLYWHFGCSRQTWKKNLVLLLGWWLSWEILLLWAPLQQLHLPWLYPNPLIAPTLKKMYVQQQWSNQAMREVDCCHHLHHAVDWFWKPLINIGLRLQYPPCQHQVLLVLPSSQKPTM